MTGPSRSGGEESDTQHQHGRNALTKVTLCLKLSTTHELTNAALVAPIAGLLATLNPDLARGEEVRLSSVGDNFFLNRELVKLDFSSFEAGQMLRGVLKRVAIEEIAFTAVLEESEVREFLASFQRCFRSKDPKAFRAEKFEKIHVRAIQKAHVDALGTEIDERQNVLRCYALVVLQARQLLAGFTNGTPPRVSRLRKALQGLVDASLGHESLLVGITRFPTLGGDLACHLASVAALAMLMGRRLGVSRSRLIELGLAALLHDVGRAELPALDGGGDPEELVRATRDVPLRSVLRICGVDPSPQMLSFAGVAYELGLPASSPDGRVPAAMARLIAVPCVFDLLTSSRPPRRGLLPDHAMRILLDKAGERFDRTVTTLFVCTLGLYPVGSTVRLTGGATAVVMEVPDDPSLYALPRVKVIRDAGGRSVDHSLDLAQDRSVAIEGSVDPLEENIDVPQFLLA